MKKLINIIKNIEDTVYNLKNVLNEEYLVILQSKNNIEKLYCIFEKKKKF
ncbi:hypothetical protein [Buchnera aphidicola]